MRGKRHPSAVVKAMTVSTVAALPSYLGPLTFAVPSFPGQCKLVQVASLSSTATAVAAGATAACKLRWGY